jgi:membrane protein DedA with SNARE-associated domain
MEPLAELIAWLQPNALLLALALPPLIRVVGHWIPEELFMIAIGVLAARSGDGLTAAAIVGAALISHFASDQAVYAVGRGLRPRIGRFPRLELRIGAVTERLTRSPWAVFGLVPARVLPIGRGAWLAACGVVRVPWPRFAAVDLLALIAHVALWSGLGWLLSGDAEGLAASAENSRLVATWTTAALVLAVAAVVLWRARRRLHAATVGGWQRIVASSSDNISRKG